MSLRWDEAVRTLDVGVRDLVVAADPHVREALAMSSRARLAAGVEAHRAVQAGYEGMRAEARLRHVVVVRGWTCTIHGRADGVGEEGDYTVVEEIKSTTLPDGSFPAWERQLGVYLWLARAARMPTPIGRLRIVSLLDGSERLVLVREPPGIEAEILACLDGWILARERRMAWRAVRRGSVVHFAHAAMRPGQAEVSLAAEAAVLEGGHLLLTAPTGMGKTAAVLHGVLRAAIALDRRVFWATARTTQQAMVEATVRRMAARGTKVRAVTLRAREKACLAAEVDCRPEVCRFADRYHERLRTGDAIDRLAELAQPDADAVARVGGEAVLCPYELALDWADAADLVIGDYNYAFDPDVFLRRCLEDPSEWVVVVEEAHQLPDRAAGWGSPEIRAVEIEGLPPIFEALAQDVREAVEDAALLPIEAIQGELLVEPYPRRWAALRDRFDDLALDALRGPDLPGWVELARAVVRFADVLERAGEETVALWSPGRLRLCQRDPSRVLAPRFGAFHASISMSATLAPTWFYRDRCGLAPDRVRCETIDAPFPPENRRVVTVPAVSTAWKQRAKHRSAIVEILERTIAAVPGNAAAFFGSFEQLADLCGEVHWPGRERLVQAPSMAESERTALLDRMREPGEPRVLCAVLGGIFAEGVDLPDGALRAAIVVGPALPPPSAERALMAAWYEERFDAGFDLAYVQPGMTRVVQAAGRVVRGPEERGLVVLLCQRFARHEYAAYLPSDWQVDRSRRPWEVAEGFFGA